MNYAIKNNILLKVNEKFKSNDYPLLYATVHNNIKMIKLLMDFSKENNIILEMDQKKKIRTMNIQCYTQPIIITSK